MLMTENHMVYYFTFKSIQSYREFLSFHEYFVCSYFQTNLWKKRSVPYLDIYCITCSHKCFIAGYTGMTTVNSACAYLWKSWGHSSTEQPQDTSAQGKLYIQSQHMLLQNTRTI